MTDFVILEQLLYCIDFTAGIGCYLYLLTDFYKYLDESWKLFINASLASASRVFYFLLLVLNAFNVLLVNLSQNSDKL